MDDSLCIYLHDHLAGAGFAIELLEKLKESYPDHRTGAFAAELLIEVREDSHVLETVIERVGKSSLDMKDALAWFGEKASRMKLRHNNPIGLGAFEAVEALSLGILGKVALWQVMPRIAQDDPRVRGYDFATLASKARAQFNKVEEYRLALALFVFRPNSSFEIPEDPH